MMDVVESEFIYNEERDTTPIYHTEFLSGHSLHWVVLLLPFSEWHRKLGPRTKEGSATGPICYISCQAALTLGPCGPAGLLMLAASVAIDLAFGHFGISL